MTTELNAFLATVQPDTTVDFPAGGRFRVEGVVTLLQRHRVTIEGHGSTLFASTDGRDARPPFFNYRAHWPRSRDHLLIRSSSDLVIHDLTVEGPNREGTFRAELEAQAGFDIIRSQHVTLDGVTARATYGDGVYVVGASTDVVVKNCTLDHNGRQGVAVVAGQRVTVEGCTINDTGRSAIDLEPGHGMVRTVHVQDNHVNRTTNFLLAAVGAGAGVQDVWLERNTVTGGKGVSLYVGTERSVRSGIHVLDNTGRGRSAGYQHVLLQFTRFDGIEVRGNHQQVAQGVTPIQLHDSCNATIGDNDFSGAASGATVKSDGDCNTPIIRGPGVTTGTGPRSGTGSTRPRRTTTTIGRAPTTATPASGRGRGTSPVTVAIAVAIGALAGIGATIGVQWGRQQRTPDS